MLLSLLGALSFPSGGKEAGLAFLEANKGKPGVIELLSGLQYKVLVPGEGKDHPTKDSPCFCHYEGRIAQNYPDGAKFDSSYDRGEPAKFAPNQVIKGWTEAMQMMVEGDKWELYIPARLAYGARGRCGRLALDACMVGSLISHARFCAGRRRSQATQSSCSRSRSRGLSADARPSMLNCDD